MKTKLSPCKVVPAGDPNPRTLPVYTREVQALLRATHKYTIAEAKHATSAADWGTLVRTAWFSGKAPCWSADHIAKFDRGGASPLHKSAKKSSHTAGAVTRKRAIRDPGLNAPFQGFAFVFKKIPSERAESPMDPRGGSPYNKALRAAQRIANAKGKTVYVDHVTRGGQKYWIIWERRYEGQYTKAEEKHLIDLRDVRETHRSVEVSPSKKGRDPVRGKGFARHGGKHSSARRDPNCFRSTRTNLHTHTVCPSKPGVYTTSSDFAHTHTVKFKAGALVTTSEDFGHTHDFDFSVTNGRDATYRRSVKSKRKLARRATPRCATLLKRLTKLAEASVKYRRAGRNLASRNAWTLMEKVSALAVKAGCGETQISEAVEDGLQAGRIL